MEKDEITMPSDMDNGIRFITKTELAKELRCR